MKRGAPRYEPHVEKLIAEQLGKQAHAAQPKKRHKYGAKPTGGYASKREHDFAAELRMRRDSPGGDVAGFAEQVEIRFACGASYIADFVALMRDGTVKIFEVKGVETSVWKLKFKMLRNELPGHADRLHVVK